MTVGNEFYTSVYIGVSDLKKGTSDSLGIAGILYQYDFDDNILEIVEIPKIDSFQTEVYKQGDSYYVLSYIDDTNASKNKCADQVLSCADYLQTFKFYLKDTDAEKTEIKLSNVNVMLFPVGSDKEEDMVTILGGEKTHVINIKKQQQVVTSTVPESVVSNSDNKEFTSDVKNFIEKVKNESALINNSTTKKEANNYLSSIEIKNYKINFKKDKLEYDIDVEEDINKLDIKAIAESENAIIDIKGADDLKGNNYKVTINVSSKDNSKKTYKINVNLIKEVEESNLFLKDFKFEMNDKTKNIIVVVSIGLAIIFLPIIIYLYKKDRELDKKLSKM